MDREHFLDLISENTQIKEEIVSLRDFRRLITLFDRHLCNTCRNSTVDLDPKFTIKDLISEFNSIQVGLKPVTSSESWKEKLKLEIFKKNQQGVVKECDTLSERRSNAMAKLSNVKNDIQNLKTKIESTKVKLTEAESIKESYQKEVQKFTQLYDISKEVINKTCSMINLEQANSVQLQRSVEQTQKTLNVYIEESSSGTSQKSVVDSVMNFKKRIDDNNINNTEAL